MFPTFSFFLFFSAVSVTGPVIFQNKIRKEGDSSSQEGGETDSLARGTAANNNDESKGDRINTEEGEERRKAFLVTHFFPLKCQCVPVKRLFSNIKYSPLQSVVSSARQNGLMELVPPVTFFKEKDWFLCRLSTATSFPFFLFPLARQPRDISQKFFLLFCRRRTFMPRRYQ